jgi:hypothetical protein
MRNDICPICGSKLTEYKISQKNWGTYETVEVHNICRNCNLYEYEYVYGNSCRKIYKKVFADKKKHRFYIWFVKFLWILKLIKKGDD